MMRLFAGQAKKREQRDELLSAYVDGQLSAGERARLEAQLATDPALQAELEALRHTVALVRDLPPVPIPRNFILPQKMKITVAARPRPARRVRPRRALRKPQGKAWAAPLLTAATAVVSLIFVVVLAGDLLLSGVGGRAFAPMAAPQMEAPQVAMEPSLVSEEVEAEVEVEVEEMIPATTPLPMPAEIPPGAAPTATVEAQYHSVETPEDVEATAWAAGGGGPVEEDAALAPSPGPAVEKAAAAPTAPATATVVMEKIADNAEATPSEVAQVAPPVASEEERGASEDEGVGPAPVSLWRMLEVTLGLTALALALTTVWAWRARRQ